MRKYFLKKIILPLSSRLTANKGWRYYNHYIRADFDPVEARRERQWQRVLNVVRHAYQHVPFYRKKYDQAGVHPKDIKCEADFRRLPVITKKELRENFPRQVIADNYPPRFMRYSNTSGTTGASLILVHDHDDINYKYASKLRSWHLMGCDIGDSVVRLTPNECQPCLPTGESPDIGILEYLRMFFGNHAHQRQAYYIFVERRITNKLLNNRRFPPPLTPDFSDTDLRNYIDVICSFKPRIISGYPLYLYLLAKFIQKNHISIPPPQGLDLTAGLSSPAMRRFIGEQFSSGVFQSYGGCELGRVASSCAQSAGRMHILEEQCYMEFIHSNGEPARPGELANIIMTALNSYGMPFIRYEHGDVGEYFEDPCPCGRTTRLMLVEGRLQDLILAANGKAIPSREILDLSLGHPGIKLFQLIQRAPDQFDFKFVKDAPEADMDLEKICDALKAVLGPGADIRPQSVDYIRSASSGKYRLVRSSTYEPFRCVSEPQTPLGNFW
jgi:phenylacetate-CoA ligase